MSTGTRLGITSALLLATILLPPYANWRGPVNAVALVLSFVLGLLAAHRGARAWLAIPGFLFLLSALLIYVAVNAR